MEDTSILNDIKKLLGIDADYTAFDTDVILHINSVIRVLNQLGIDASSFYITDASSKWSELLGENFGLLDEVKMYIYLRVRMLFDPPQNSFIVNSLKEQIDELAWRINVAVDPGDE